MESYAEVDYGQITMAAMNDQRTIQELHNALAAQAETHDRERANLRLEIVHLQAELENAREVSSNNYRAYLEERKANYDLQERLEAEAKVRAELARLLGRTAKAIREDTAIEEENAAHEAEKTLRRLKAEKLLE